jgi:cellulase
MLTQTLLTAVLFSVASAHQTLKHLWINDKAPDGYGVGIRKAQTNSPVKDIKSDAMACNIPTTEPVKTVAANAGDSIKVQWSPIVHPGPITHFLKPVANAATDTGVGAGWFKIDELDFVDGKWGSEVMIANNMTHDFKLPTGLASGEYLVSPHISMTSTKDSANK